MRYHTRAFGDRWAIYDTTTGKCIYVPNHEAGRDACRVLNFADLADEARVRENVALRIRRENAEEKI